MNITYFIIIVTILLLITIDTIIIIQNCCKCRYKIYSLYLYYNLIIEMWPFFDSYNYFILLLKNF